MDRIRLQTDLYGAMTNGHTLKTMRRPTKGKDHRYRIIGRCFCQPARLLQMAATAFADKRITIMGLVFFGGTIGLARYLVSQGAQVTVTDLKPAAELQDSIAALHGLPVRFVLGRHESTDFPDVDMVVASAAVRDDSA